MNCSTKLENLLVDQVDLADLLILIHPDLNKDVISQFSGSIWQSR